mgnify:CR=1 FL=1
MLDDEHAEVLRIGHGPAQDVGIGNRFHAVGHGDGDHHLVVARRVGDADLDRVEVGAHERRILVMERHVERGAGAAALLRARDDGLAAAHPFAERRPELRMEHRGHVFEFALHADDAALAVTVDGPAPEFLHRDGDELRAERHARLDERLEVLDVAMSL